MTDGQKSPGERAFEKVCHGQELTTAESAALFQSYGIRMEPTVQDQRTSMQKILQTDKRETEIQGHDERTITQPTPDTVDLVTGERIVNIPLSSIPNEIGERVYHGLEAAFNRSQNGEQQNIQSLVDTCDTQGPFRGFKRLLTPEQLQRLQHADTELAEHCFRQFVRLCLAEDTEDIIKGVTQALHQHIDPLLPQIRTPETRQSIEEALQLWKTNLENPVRNIYRRTARVAKPGEEIGRQYAMPLYLQNPSYFSVGIMDSGNAPDNVGGGYDAPMRVVILRRKPPRASYDFLEALDALHELTHISQHNRFLRTHGRGDPQRLDACHQTYIYNIVESSLHVHGILEEECEAFANMIEPIIAITGFGSLQIPEVMRKLGIDPNDENKGRQVYSLLRFAVDYFKGGCRTGSQFPAQYINTLEQFYTRLNVHLIRLADIRIPD